MHLLLIFTLFLTSMTTTLKAQDDLTAAVQKEGTKEVKKEESPHHLTSIVAFLSDYRSRGISQTMLGGAVQGEIDYLHTSGLYFKMWASNIDARVINRANLEGNLYLGLKRPLFNTQAKYDVGFLFYYYPGGAARVRADTSYNTIEYYIAFDYNKLEIKLSLTLNDFFGTNSSNPPLNWNKARPASPNGHSFGSPYIELNYEFSIYEKWKAAIHLGYQGVTNYQELNYVDGLLTITRAFDWFELSLAYVQTNGKKAYYSIPTVLEHPHKHRKNLGGPGAVLALTKIF